MPLNPLIQVKSYCFIIFTIGPAFGQSRDDITVLISGKTVEYQIGQLAVYGIGIGKKGINVVGKAYHAFG
jgi:hypothetical protein